MWTWLLLFLAAFAAGMINSIAGGGTLLTFPALLAFGLPSVSANATSTVALVPGSFSAFLGFRESKRFGVATDLQFLGVSAAGGLVGAIALLRLGDALFSKLVPWLILGATLLFILQEPLRHWQERRSGRRTEHDARDGHLPHRALVVQFLIAIYGGFFGAGCGILMLAAFGFLGLGDVYQMNRLKNLANVGFNTIASATFIVAHHVDGPLAALMTVGAAAGGYAGAGAAKRIGPRNVKRTVIAVGLSMSAYTLLKTH
jgi:uncharacterized membrane protein YfcA